MRAVKLTHRPEFSLMKQTDIQNIYHMQMPRWLFSDPRYCDMSLDAKVAYTFLLNRFQLSRRNGWVNEDNEVFVIFPRKAMAKELRICEQRVTAAFKVLVKLNLIWEKRCGRGDANQIYLATVEPMEDKNYECAPFISEDGACDFRNADTEVLDDINPKETLEKPTENACGDSVPAQEPQNPSVKNSENCVSRTADIEALEPQNPCPSYKENSYINLSEKEVSQSVRHWHTRDAPPIDRQTDASEDELEDILENCELHCFSPETAQVFENAVERLFYADRVRLGNATLPQSRIRRKLQLLDGIILRDVERKLAANLDCNVKNSTAYTMTVIINCIAESESDLMVDPYLNSLRSPPMVGV